MAENLQQGSEYAAPAAQLKGLAIAALVTGLGALASMLAFVLTAVGTSFLAAGVILGIAGVILGAVALKKQQSKGMSLTGLIAGSISVLLAVALIVFAFLFIGAFMSESPYL